VAEDMPPRKAARIIMKTLPVCKERGISYATFTLVDIDRQSQVKIIEYDNPAYLLFRQAAEPVLLEPLKRDLVVRRPAGSRTYPLGWGIPRIQAHVMNLIQETPDISARKLAQIFRDFTGAKVLCGGTTASIIARELGRTIKVNLKNLDLRIPPASTMDGADLVTEGIITLGKVAELLESPSTTDRYRVNPATQLTELLLNSDCIEFVVGTKINEAHQDPTMPVELEIRRNIIKRIARLLEEKYLKEIQIRFI